MKVFLQRHPIASYFGIAFLLSWGSGLVLLGPKLARGETIPALSALLLFPVLVVGVGLTGLVLTALVDGRTGVRALFSRMGHWRVDAQWYLAALIIPPLLILAVLLALRSLVSPNFVPNFFPIGVLFGVIPGFFEEIGWTGYAFPRMQSGRSSLAASLLLGVLWGMWHLPVVDSLGAAARTERIGCPFVWPSSHS